MKFHGMNSIKRRRGAALVEFAFTFPIIMLCFASVFEFCRVLMLQHTADSAAYEAARAAMVPGATAEDATSAANSLLRSNRLQSTNIIIDPEKIDEETAFLTVRVEIPVRQNSWLPPFWFTRSTVSSEVTLLCERPPIVQLTGLPLLKVKLQKAKNKESGL